MWSSIGKLGRLQIILISLWYHRRWRFLFHIGRWSCIVSDRVRMNIPGNLRRLEVIGIVWNHFLFFVMPLGVIAFKIYISKVDIFWFTHRLPCKHYSEIIMIGSILNNLLYLLTHEAQYCCLMCDVFLVPGYGYFYRYL